MLRKIGWVLLSGTSLLFAAPSEVSLKGTVKKADGTAISGAKVYLASDTSKKVTTGNDGKFSLEIVKTAKPYDINVQKSVEVSGQGASLCFSVNTAISNGSVTLFSGNGRIVKNIVLKNLSAGSHSVPLVGISNGFYVLQIAMGDQTVRRRVITAGSEVYISEYETKKGETRSGGKLAKITAAVDTLIATKEGFVTKRTAVDAYVKEGIEIVLDTEGTTVCEVPDLPSASSLTYNNSKMPDPFTFKFMNLPRVTTKAQWECRRAEILAMAQEYLYGHLPPKPESVTGTVSGGKITVNMKQGSKTSSFSVTASGSGDILVIDFSSGAPSPSGARKASLTPSTILDIMKSLYGSTDAGTCIAAAWGVGRIIDVLELNPDGGIDATKVVTTGCSFAGKFALAAGVFEPRVGLCVPVESGAVGTSSWRVSKSYGGDNSNANCQDIQHLEQNWLGTVAGPFRNGQVNINKLPFDQHEVMALRAPRPMIAFNNYKEWKWLCAKGNVAAAQGCHWIYKALGASDNFGFAESEFDHGHCQFPNEHKSEVQAFYDKFLNGKSDTNTKIMRWHSSMQETEKWFDWDTTVVLQ